MPGHDLYQDHLAAQRRDVVEALGGEVILIEIVPGHSTSAMVERTRAPKT